MQCVCDVRASEMCAMCNVCNFLASHELFCSQTNTILRDLCEYVIITIEYIYDTHSRAYIYYTVIFISWVSRFAVPLHEAADG